MPSQLDLDQGGTFRQFQRVFMGPSVGWLTVPTDAILDVTAGGTYAIARGTNLIRISADADVQVSLPSSKATAQGPQAIPGQWVLEDTTILDIGGFAGNRTYNIVPFGTELISGLASVQLAAPRGTIVLEPLIQTGGWNLKQ